MEEKHAKRDRNDCLCIRARIFSCEAWGRVRSHECESVRRIAVSDWAVENAMTSRLPIACRDDEKREVRGS